MKSGIPTDELVELVEASPFGAEKPGVRSILPGPFLDLPLTGDRSMTISMSDHVTFKVEQAEYNAVWALPANFRRQALRIFDMVLEKVLHEEIRVKRGLAYSISTGSPFYCDVYEFTIRCLVHPNSSDSIDQLVRDCIDKAALNKDYFERKRRLCEQECNMTDVSGAGLANITGNDLAKFHRIETMTEILSEVREVQYEYMSEMAALLTSREPYVLITNP